MGLGKAKGEPRRQSGGRRLGSGLAGHRRERAPDEKGDSQALHLSTWGWGEGEDGVRMGSLMGTERLQQGLVSRKR